MNEETTSQESASTETAPPNAAPEADLSFRQHVKWRTMGELPAKEDEPPPAAAEPPEGEPPAKTDPTSGAEEEQQDEEDEPEEEQSSAAKRRKGARERRIDRLTRENEQLKQALAQSHPPAPQTAKTEPPGKPQLAQFDTLEEYQEALTEYHITQREAQRDAAAEQRKAQEAEQKLQTEWDSRQRAARKAHADYDDTIEAIAAPDGPGVMAARQAMLEDEAGAEILYYLAKHPAEIKRIAALSPIAAVREIGRLSATLSPSSSAANGKQRFTSAPKPPPPNTRPAKTGSDSIDDPAVQADFKRYVKARAAMKDK